MSEQPSREPLSGPPAPGPSDGRPTRSGARLRAALAFGGLFLFVFAALALTGPGRIDIVDGQTRYEVAHSLVEHGDSVIRDKHVWFPVSKGRNGDRYTLYRFPQTGLGVLAILAADLSGPATEARRQFFFTLISPFAGAVLAVTYAVWFYGLGYGLRASLLWSLAGLFCTPNWYYGTSAFDDMLGASAVVLAVAAAFLGRGRRSLLGAAVAGLALGWAVNCKQPYGLFTLPVLAALYRPGIPLRRQLAPAALVGLGLLLGGIAYKLYDWHKFPPGTPDPYERYVAEYGAIYTADPLPGLVGLTLSPASGALWYCPTLLLSFHGWLAWRRRLPLFSYAVLAACLGFLVFLSFLTFFKGDPCWGPRYLTPAFALAWVFAPAALPGIRRALCATLLAVGGAVQLLGLSVDPHRLFLEQALPFDYYLGSPWQGFDVRASHLAQRPREILDTLANSGMRAPFFSPAPSPTFAPGLPPRLPVVLTGALGVTAYPGPDHLRILGLYPTMLLGDLAYFQQQYREAVPKYHIFSSFRPWWISQQYLSAEQRPVDLGKTAAFLAAVASLGLVLMLGAGRGSGRLAAGLAGQQQHG
jgi:hypothetical protein